MAGALPLRANRVPPPQLTDGVVELRPWRAGDSTTARNWAVPPTARNGARDSELRTPLHDRLHLAIVAAASGSLMGYCHLHTPDPGDPDVVEVGYLLIPQAQGAGNATRAMRLLMDWAFAELGIARMQALVDPSNDRSVAVLLRVGFEQEGRLRRFRLGAGGRADRLIFSALPGDRQAEAS
jgi:RimJ/RimL family protein N-acetyltransferase